MHTPLRLAQRDQDVFVAAAHDQPLEAGSMLHACPALAKARSSWGETALQAASHLGHRSLIADLVEVGVELDIFAACAIGDQLTVSRTLRSVPRPAYGVHGLPVLHFAVMSLDISMVEMLLAAGEPVNPERESLTPLHSAVAVNFTSAVRLLLRHGADAGARDPFGATAEEWAIELCGPNSRIRDLVSAAPST
jgi:ankyrin repeat protein